MPAEWLIGRLCEEFPALTPSTAVNEPLELCLAIIEARAYAAAKRRVDDVDAGRAKGDDLPKGDSMIEAVQDNQFERARETMEQRRRG